MKRTVFVSVLIFVCFTAIAGGLEFTPVSVSPIYKSYKADIWNFSTQGQLIYDTQSKLDSILVQSKYEVGKESAYFNFNKVNGPYVEEYVNELAKFSSNKYNTFLRFKPAFTFGFLKLGYSDFKVQGFLQLSLNTILCIGHGNDLLGYDGMYCYGLEASYKNLVEIKVGKHHLSGHYGDEVIESLYERNDASGRSYLNRFKASSSDSSHIEKVSEYVRQDSLIVGVSVRPFSLMRVYAEVDMNLNKMNTLRPYVVVPNKIVCSFMDCDMVGRTGSTEGIMQSNTETRRYPYSDKYRGFIVNAGVEFSYSFKNSGDLSLSYNCRLNQEGQTMYQFNCYKETNPWYIDHTVVLDFRFKSTPLSAQIMFHKGQMPLLNYFYQRGTYVTAGLGIEF